MALQSPYLEPQLSSVTIAMQLDAAGCSWNLGRPTWLEAPGPSSEAQQTWRPFTGYSEVLLVKRPSEKSLNMWILADYCRVLEANNETTENAPDMHKGVPPHCWPAIWFEGEAHSILGTSFR